MGGSAGAGPQALEGMQGVLQTFQLHEAIEEADQQAQMLNWQREQQSVVWYIYPTTWSIG